METMIYTVEDNVQKLARAMSTDSILVSLSIVSLFNIIVFDLVKLHSWYDVTYLPWIMERPAALDVLLLIQCMLPMYRICNVNHEISLARARPTNRKTCYF